MVGERVADASPLTPAQIWVLLASAGRELTWGLRATARELRAWRELAERIPDAKLREDALHSLTQKRGHADGAALFTILRRRRDERLLHTLVAYETLIDYLDDVSERHPTHANGQRLHQALIDAVDPDRPLIDYYRFNPEREDGGYLLALVNACREGCRALPSFGRVRDVLAREQQRVLVLGLNHELDAAPRDAALRRWAGREFPGEQAFAWYELSGAASASLMVHGLLTLAADPRVTEQEVTAVHAAHWPWIALATTMVDAYVDMADDAASGAHSYVSHYPDEQTMVRRLHDSVAGSMRAALRLPDGERHAVLVGGMIALFLSKPSAHAPAQRATTRALVRSGGSLVRLMLPILRLWRALNGQRR